MLESDPQTIAVLNAVTIGLWVAAVVDVIRTPRTEWYNYRGKVLTVLIVAAPSFFYRGVFVPLTPLIWFVWWRRAGGLGRFPKTPGAATGPPEATSDRHSSA